MGTMRRQENALVADAEWGEDALQSGSFVQPSTSKLKEEDIARYCCFCCISVKDAVYHPVGADATRLSK